MERRSRLAPEVRRGLLIDAASRLILEQGHLPIPGEKLSSAAGVSKALIYAYFPTQADLFNAVLERQFAALAAAGIETASRRTPFDEACLACASIYFEHVATVGPLAHIVLRDHYMVGRLSSANRSFRDRLLGRLARGARKELQLGAKETVAAVNLIITIPEESGRLVYEGDLSLERGRALCAQLTASAVASLTPSPPDESGGRR